jgi:hypothetical protein
MQKIELRIKGLIDRDWSNWLVKPSVIHTSSGETLLTGIAEDQSAFYGLLSRLSSLGLQVISLTCDWGHASTGKEAGKM